MQKKELIALYHEMVLIRRLEERAAELYQEGKIGGFLHLYIGHHCLPGSRYRSSMRCQCEGSHG